jgi:hypothetical protein
MSVSFVDNERHLYPYFVFIRKGRWFGKRGIGRIGVSGDRGYLSILDNKYNTVPLDSLLCSPS